jgi:hypothetical protein
MKMSRPKKIAVSLAILVVGLLAVFGVLFASRFVSIIEPKVPWWTRSQAQANVIDHCQMVSSDAVPELKRITRNIMTDFSREHRGDARLAQIYATQDRKYFIFYLDNYRDAWFRYRFDAYIAYVYDRNRKELVGKFGVNMA